MVFKLFLLIVFLRTVKSIRKLLVRRCEKTSVKKMIFMVLNLGKVKKYLCKLDAVATKIEVRKSQCKTFCSLLAANNGLYGRGSQGVLST
jgi:hypothetical protein